MPLLAAGAQLAGAQSASIEALRNLRVVYGFDREYPPFSYEDPGGKAVGFEVELMEAIFRGRATLSLRPLNWYSIPMELSSGTITVTSGMILTPQRARAYGFSELPTFNMKIRFFTKTYKRVPNATFLRGQSVSVEDNSYQKNLMEEFGGINVKPFNSRQLALRALYNDEVEAYCGLDEPAYYLIRKLNYGAITTVGAPLGQVEMRIAVNRDRGDVLRLVNDGLRDLIAGGEYDRIYRRWFITELDRQEIEAMVKAARTATVSSYAPYGKINYGAAILTATGKIYAGCNVEGPDPSLNTTALAAAMARCVSENELEWRAAVLVDQNGKILLPGNPDCLRLNEFGRGTLVLTLNAEGKLASPMVTELLPNPVTKEVLFAKSPQDFAPERAQK
ncbi:transporter substrate-binding domain-containing protein [Desulfovibrio sp. OttesenSCG-928-C14]|nr:transporter substrate-binding domain-containing protein [Desulfovibrio sp. OttesenSCG-928-C14]